MCAHVHCTVHYNNGGIGESTSENIKCIMGPYVRTHPGPREADVSKAQLSPPAAIDTSPVSPT